MSKLITKIFLIFALLFAGFNYATAAPVIKITGLLFDNSDNAIIVKSYGTIFLKDDSKQDETKSDRTPENIITKASLSNPNRIFVDITNAVLVGGSQTYTLKNSAIDSVKISQFSTNPHTVRIVLSYNKKFDEKNFKVFANDRQIILRYKNELVSGQNFKTIYNNMTKGEHVADVFESLTYSVFKRPAIQNVSNDLAEQKVNPDLKSYFFINAVQSLKNGIMIKGSGFLSLKNSFMLDEPNRLVVDIENANVSTNLRNKSFSIPNSSPLVDGANVNQRELLRIGQNESNIARLVIQGQNAKDYRMVISPDMQGLFIAKRTDILNSKLTETTSKVLSYSVKNSMENLNVVDINFSTPVTLTMFEENSKFYVDLQNVADYNPEALKALTENPFCKDVLGQKIALEKSRLIFPIKDTTAINAQVSSDAKQLRIYFKERQKDEQIKAEKHQSELKSDKKSTSIKLPDIRPSVIKQMYKVVIDAGHGGSDVGATRDGIYEKNITLNVSKLVQKYLTKQGVYTYMTRETDKYVELCDRSDFSNSVSPDVFVSIHVNSSARDDVIGLETHWWKEDSLEYAKKVHKNFASAKNLSKWDTKDRGLFKSQFYVINHTEAPAVLVEIGFISTAYERKQLTDQKRQEEIAKSITEGIMEYLKSR